MKIDYDVPFYGNTSDDTHCFQACLRMILKYFQPEKEFTWEKLEKITAKVEGLWTWPTAGMLWMQKNGYEVKEINPFDYYGFIKGGGKFLIDECGEEVGKAQIAHSDIEQEQRLSKLFLEQSNPEKRIPNLQDIKDLLINGFLVICNVNARALNKEDGYCGHFVVVKGFDENSLLINNPGLPPIKNQKVDFDRFEKAWAYPSEGQNITAFKLKK